VLSIDETAGLVKVDNHGQALTLSFDKDGIKAPSGPAVPVTGHGQLYTTAGRIYAVAEGPPGTLLVGGPSGITKLKLPQ